MYLHVGQETMVNTREIIGIFDLDTASLSKKTRETLARAQKENRVIDTGPELPRSFILAEPSVFYISQLSTATLKGRVEAGAAKQMFETTKNLPAAGDGV